jgi:glycine/D-amino acid oxidase-like deaminating enzyme/nitrite reductase/ring-hydroxylating ferredoxin subunit
MSINNRQVTDTVWEKTNEKLPTYIALDANIKTQICIIGTGITGLTTAYHLLKAGKDVVLVESKKIGFGETGNTSAHLSNALDDRYYQLEKFHGRDKATLAAKSHAEAIDTIEKIILTEQINCNFSRVNGYLFSANNDKQKKVLENEYITAKQCGFKDIVLTDKPIPNTNHLGKYIIFPNQAQFHPLKYLQALAKAVAAMGGKIYENTHVENIQTGSLLQVKTSSGNYIVADNVVTATNAPFQANLSIHAKLIPNRTYVIVASIAKDSQVKSLYWDMEDPYHYVRVQAYDDQHDVLIVGGEDHRVGIMPKHNPFDKLEQWTRQYFPGIIKIIHQWSGQILDPIDYLAYIGKHPTLNNVYMATGDSGNGLTHGTIAAKIISDAILQRKNAYTDLYKTNRKSARAWMNFLKTNLAAAKAYLAYFSLKHFRSVKRISAGQGAIIQCGLNKLAVYKTHDNELKVCTAICSHLHAIVQWNSIEKSWDCPAHGSRFDVNGNVLNGPANKCLESKICPGKY